MSLGDSFIAVLVFRCECYDYLFDIAVEMNKLGLDTTV